MKPPRQEAGLEEVEKRTLDGLSVRPPVDRAVRTERYRLKGRHFRRPRQDRPHPDHDSIRSNAQRTFTEPARYGLNHGLDQIALESVERDRSCIHLQAVDNPMLVTRN